MMLYYKTAENSQINAKSHESQNQEGVNFLLQKYGLAQNVDLS